MSDNAQKLDMASLLVFEPFSRFPPGLKIRVHDEGRLDSLGLSVAVKEADGALVLDLDQVISKAADAPATDTADLSSGALLAKP
ncbi:MAG TPA: hypothetical protein PKB14_02500 [Rubrivivax sp.]|nr:hypothetical protein [Rubrivivax sp.]